ncbi:MAG: ATP-binding protein [Thermodesulfovibrionales bacterium]|nr:ATP-binding protein [Thermodesulfovibrionales bacterium]
MFTIARYLKNYRQGNTEINTTVRDTPLYLDAFAKEIRSLKEQLTVRERYAIIGEISAGIAHELRNPLAVIAGNTKLLMRHLKNEEDLKLAEGILKEVDEINKITFDLLKFTKDVSINKSEINLTEMITYIVESSPYKNKIRFEKKPPIILKADGQLLKQAIRNIINNGCEAGSEVNLDIVKEIIDGSEYVLINVRDNGQGLKPEEIEKAFMPFYSTKQKGFGIGLPFAQKVVYEHGGSIKVESIEGIGSTFTISLPIN